MPLTWYSDKYRGTSPYLTWGNKTLKRPSPFPICAGWDRLLVSPETPRPRESARVHCVPGEGWSPAEPEHRGEASRRRCSVVRRAVRVASPLAAEPDGARVTCADGVTCAARVGTRRAGAHRRDGVDLKSHLVAYQHTAASTTTTTTAPHDDDDRRRRPPRRRRRPPRPRRPRHRHRHRRPRPRRRPRPGADELGSRDRPRGTRRRPTGTAPARRCPSARCSP